MANVPTSVPDVSAVSGPAFGSRALAFAKRMAPRLGYPLFYLFCLLVFIVWTFPYEKLKDRIVAQFNAQQSKSRNPQMLQIDDLDSSFITGIKATGVRLISPSADPTKAPSVLTIDEARARISVLSAIFGTNAVSFRIDAFDGVIKGDFDDNGKTRNVEVNFDDVDVGRIDLIAANIGFPLDGKLKGTLKLSMAEGKATKANGSIDLEIHDLYAGTAKELNLKTPLGPFSLPRLKIGNVNIVGEAKDGVLRLTKITASGGDVDVNGDGRIQLREVANDAHLDVGLKFKINDSYRTKNDKTKMLFGSPDPKDKPMLDLNPQMAKAKTPDGYYGLRIGGTLGKPDVRPGL